MFESISPFEKNDAPKAPPAPTTPLEIHTMPERFLGSSSASGKPGSPKPKGKSRKILIALAVILVVALGVIAAVLFTDVLNRNSANVNNTNLVINTSTGNLNANANGNLNANGNANSNLNANSNTNEVTNENFNSNVNTNSNANSNANSNTNANANANSNVSNSQAKSSVDTDKDGLTDAEEVIFGTNPSSQDTDKDGFLDGQEVKLGYNPNGTGKLLGSSIVSEFINSLYGASVLYPKSWSLVARSATEEIFSNPTADEAITFSVQDNAARLTAKQWYIQASPSVDATSLTEIATWDGKSNGILSPDGLAYYFANGGQLYIISLSFGLKPTVDSRTTFEMLARSLSVDPAKINLNTNSAINLNSNSNSNLNSNLNSNSNSNSNANANANVNANSNTNSNTNI